MAVKELYLVRHGQATTPQIDPQRPLAPEGRSQVERTASILKGINLSVEVIYHSGKTRAEETADTLSSYLKPSQGNRWRRGLNPNDPVVDILEELDAEEFEKIMIVGHLPFLELFASRLLSGKANPRIVDIPTATAVGLHRTGEVWTIKWILDPSLVGS